MNCSLSHISINRLSHLQCLGARCDGVRLESVKRIKGGREKERDFKRVCMSDKRNNERVAMMAAKGDEISYGGLEREYEQGNGRNAERRVERVITYNYNNSGTRCEEKSGERPRRTKKEVLTGREYECCCCCYEFICMKVDDDDDDENDDVDAERFIARIPFNAARI